MPTLVEQLGLQGYAVFLLLTGLAAWFMLGDMGLGNALQNAVSRANRHGDEAQKVIRWGFKRLALLWMGLLVACIPAAFLLGKWLLGGFAHLDGSTCVALFALTGALYLTSAIGSATYKIWYATDQGWKANAVTLASSLVTLATIGRLNDVPQEARLYAALLLFVGPQSLAAAGAFCWRWWRVEKGPAASVANNEGREIATERQKIPNQALQFFGFGLLAALVLNVDYILMSRLLPAKDIVTYGLISRIFLLYSMLYGTALQALWPVCTRMLQERRADEARGAIRRLMVLGTMLLAATTLVLLAFDKPLLNLFAPGREVVADTVLVLLFAFYYLVRLWTDTHAMVLQSCGHLAPLWSSVPLQALLSVTAQAVFIGWLGVEGVLIGLLVSYLLTVAWILPMYTRRLLVAD